MGNQKLTNLRSNIFKTIGGLDTWNPYNIWTADWNGILVYGPRSFSAAF